MKLCSRCNKRPAVIFVNKIEGSKVTSEGICMKCAKELNIKPFSEYMEQMGIKEDDMDMLEEEMGQIFEENPDDANSMPTLNLQSLFGALQHKDPQNADKENENDNIDKSSSGDKIKDKNKDKDKKHGKMLETYCLDLTGRAREGKLDNVIGRENELNRLIQILCRRQKNNPCLIGEPGVGKTSIAELLALSIASGNVPYKLKKKEVFLLDLTGLVAGTHFRGQFESRVKNLIDEVKKAGNIILVIDEIHTIVGAGDSEGGMSCANILKPALSRGEIQIIGATTLAEYRKYIEKDQALERRFQPVFVDEPSIENTVTMLKGIKEHYEKFHGLSVPDDMLYKIVSLSERYITDRFLPDKAIDILDEACSKKALSSEVINEINRLNDQIAKEKAEKETLESNTEPDDSVYARIAELKISEIKNNEKLSELTKERENITITLDDIANVIENWTGIPASDVSENEYEKISGLSKRLTDRIIGQDKAIELVCKAIKRRRAGISAKKKPVSFIFAGPTGVGKTELVKRLAEYLFDSPESLIRLDMSEFMEKHAVSRIIGAPPGYVGYDDAGQLTEKIRRKPYSVILFDEIEKAHPDVLNILLQILDDGTVSDAHGKKVNFENTVIIMTTNAGTNVKTSVTGFGHSFEDIDEEKTLKGLESFLRPEFINRVDKIVTFNRLSKEDFIRIAELQLSDLKHSLDEKGIEFNFDEKISSHIAEVSFSEKYGARNISRTIQNDIEDKIAEIIIDKYGSKPKKIDITYDNEVKINIE